MTSATALLAAPLALALVATPAPKEAEVEFTFADPDIVESSGLVMTDELAVTVNDSGDEARIFVVDRSTGKTVGVTRWAGEVTDVEALAPAGDGEVWVGDIGDNLGNRDAVTVIRVPFGAEDQQVEGESYDLVYPDGPRDAEALVSDPEDGRLYVISKDVFGGTVYRAPKQLDPDGANELEAVAEAPGIVTDAAWTPDGDRVLIRNYGRLFAYAMPGFDELGVMTLPAQPQGEGLAVDPDGEVFLSSEGAESDVLRVQLPAEMRGEAESASPGAESEQGSTPSGDPDTHPADDAVDDPEIWPWVLGSGVGIVALVVLIRSLRPR